jgi:hypothetical protein
MPLTDADIQNLKPGAALIWRKVPAGRFKTIKDETLVSFVRATAKRVIVFYAMAAKAVDPQWLRIATDQESQRHDHNQEKTARMIGIFLNETKA